MNKLFIVLILVLTTGISFGQSLYFKAVNCSIKVKSKEWSVSRPTDIPVVWNLGAHKVTIFTETLQVIRYSKLSTLLDERVIYGGFGTDSDNYRVYLAVYKLENNDIYLEIHYKDLFIKYELLPVSEFDY